MIIWVNRGFCFIILLGIFLVFQNSILYTFRLFWWPVQKKIGRNRNKVRIHLTRIFQVVSSSTRINQKVSAFLSINIFIFGVTSYYLLRGFGFRGIFLSILISAFPYGVLRAKLYLTQIKGSFEGEMLVSEFLNQYKICNRNIYATLNACVKELEDNTLSKRAMLQLAIRIKTYEKEVELREALKDFITNWNTTWSRMLADNIYNAIWERIDVLDGLENIMNECKGISKKLEKNKQEDMVAEAVVKVLCPLFLFSLIFIAKDAMGYSWKTIYSYSLEERSGLMIISMILFLAGFNIVAFPILGKQKYDF